MIKQRQKSRHDISYKKFDKNSSSDEETELFVRNKTPKRDIPTVEKLIEEGDTLQSLAIRYHCTIEDLKRLNNIHKENEIYAKRSIKVPHHPLSAALAGTHVSGSSSPQKPTNNSTDSIKIDTILTGTLINLSNENKKEDKIVNEIIFNSSIIQKPAQVIESSTVQNNLDINEEEVSLLPQEPAEVVVEPLTAKLKCSGVDGDISLGALIFCIVTLIFVFPVVYVMFIAEHTEKHHHEDHRS